MRSSGLGVTASAEINDAKGTRYTTRRLDTGRMRRCSITEAALWRRAMGQQRAEQTESANPAIMTIMRIRRPTQRFRKHIRGAMKIRVDLLAAASLAVLLSTGCTQSNPIIPTTQNTVFSMSIKNGTRTKLSIVPGQRQCMLQTPPMRTLSPNQLWSGHVVLAGLCSSKRWFFDITFENGPAVAGGTWTKTGSQPWEIVLFTHGLALKADRGYDAIFHVTVVRTKT